MDYQLKVQGQVYIFSSKNELEKAKEMSPNELKKYTKQLESEDELQEFDENFEEDEEVQKETEEEPSNSPAINPNIMILDEQISELEKQRNVLNNSLANATNLEDYQRITSDVINLQTQIDSLRNQILGYLNTSIENSAAETMNNAPFEGNAQGMTGANIVNYAESFLGEKNPSKKEGVNPFVRVERGGSCDDFATYIIDNSINKENLADWYNELSENEKAWGPDIFRAAKEAGATVSEKEAQAGDLAAIDLNGNGGMDHTVIIKEIKDGKVYTIESNGGSIVNKTYKTSQICNIARVTKQL